MHHSHRVLLSGGLFVKDNTQYWKSGSLSRRPSGLRSGEEIILVVGGEITLGTRLAAQGLPITDQLQVLKPARDAAVAVGVECIEGDRGPAVHTRVHIAAVQHRVALGINDAGGRCAVGIDEEGILIGGIIGAVDVAVAQGGLQRCKGRGRLAASLQLRLTFLVCSLDGGLDLLHRGLVALGDDQGYRVLGRPPVDGLGLPDIGVRPSGVLSGDYLHGICYC